jgi:serine/threonine-protein kinase
MPDEPRVQELLADLLDRQATPEEVCGACLELLPVVRERWGQICRARAELDALLPIGTHGSLPTPPPEELPLPQIPGYEVEAVLGRGGMGVVYRARHLRLGRPVALKMALAGSHAGPNERERFRCEALAVAALRHPNVVQVYDVGDADGRPFFTMELMEGGSLARKLAGAPQPARQAAALLATLAGAVQKAHEAGVIHRDLKPGNVLLTADGTPKVADFGLARRLDADERLTLSGAVVGTPSYTAPEQARGDRGAVGPRTDVYALGAILYECLTGRPPFRAGTAAATLQQVLADEPVAPRRLNPQVPRDLETICSKCLRKESSLRYATADALNEDLTRFLRGDAISARPEGRTRRALRTVRRRPTLAVAVTAAALISTLILAAGSWLLFDRAVVDRAVTGDLEEIEDLLQRSSFKEAKTAIERAQARLGTREAPALRRRLNQLSRAWELADRLDRIHFELALTMNGELGSKQADQEYDEVFQEFGVGRNGDDPITVAARVRESAIRVTLLAALDRWSVDARTPGRADWAMGVANLAEPERSPWRAAARNPELRRNRTALLGMIDIDRADIEKESVALLQALSSSLTATNPLPPGRSGLRELGRALLKDSKYQLPFLTKVQQAHPGDLWANFNLGWVLLFGNRPDDAVQYFQAVIALRPRSLIGYHFIGMALSSSLSSHSPKRYDEAIVLLRKGLEIDPNSVGTQLVLYEVLNAAGKYDEAISQAEIVLRFNFEVARLRAILGSNLRAKGRVEEGFEQIRLAYALEPDNAFVQNAYRFALMQESRWNELRLVWAKALEGDRPNHDDWYGYAEMCLYLGLEDEYRRARKALLARFGTSGLPYVAERTARACLLLPVSGEELSTAVALAELAARADPKEFAAIYPYLQFVKGLAEYRQGHFDRAIAIMRGDASKMPGPLRLLVLSMALHRTDQEAEARKTLAAAMLNHDWRENQVNSPDGWIRHVLRREAEKMIVPNLTAMLEGKQQPRDNDERIAQIGVCRFENRFAALARIYAEAFAADPKLTARHRYDAARVAVQAGCGRGIDAGGLSDAERRNWRTQARKWLREDLSAAIGIPDRDFNKFRGDVHNALKAWQNEPELAGIRDATELEKLLPDEQADCRKLWAEVNAVLDSTSKPK